MNKTDTENQNTLENKSDQELIELYRQGNKDIIEELLKRYSSRIYRLAYGILRNSQDVEEVVQEVFLKVFQKFDSFKGEASFSSWLYRIAVNTTLMKIRERQNAELLPLESMEQFEEEISKTGISDWARLPDDELFTEEATKLITSAMEKLPDEFKMVVTLRDVEGLSTEEVAKILGLTPAAVKSRLHRARLFLRKRLTNFYQHFLEGD